MTFNWKSRKLWAAIVTLLVMLLVSAGVIGEIEGEMLGEMILAVLGIFGLYVAGNVGEHLAARGAKLTLTETEKDIMARALADAQTRVISQKQEDRDWTDTAGSVLKAVAGKLIPFL